MSHLQISDLEISDLRSQEFLTASYEPLTDTVLFPLISETSLKEIFFPCDGFAWVFTHLKVGCRQWN